MAYRYGAAPDEEDPEAIAEASMNIMSPMPGIGATMPGRDPNIMQVQRPPIMPGGVSQAYRQASAPVMQQGARRGLRYWGDPNERQFQSGELYAHGGRIAEKIDRKHDVPYLAGANRAGGKTFIDRSIPKTIPVGGRQLNPAKYLHIHEQVEHDLMDKGKTYAAAHKVALKHERAELRKDGISWDQYQRTMYRLVKEVGGKKVTKPPADLDTRPYPPDVLIDKLGMRRAKGGSVPGITQTMQEWKAGKLHSGSKAGPVVKSQKQALAIALSEQRRAKRADGGDVPDVGANPALDPNADTSGDTSTDTSADTSTDTTDTSTQDEATSKRSKTKGLMKIAQDMLGDKQDTQTAAELERRVAALSGRQTQEVIPYTTQATGMTGVGAGISRAKPGEVEISGAPSAFGYSGGFGTPGTYGIGQAGIPLYGGVPMMRARGGQSANQANPPAFIRYLKQMMVKNGYYKGPVNSTAGKDLHAAILKYQQDHGLSPTSTITAETLAHMQGRRAVPSPPTRPVIPDPSGARPLPQPGQDLTGVSARPLLHPGQNLTGIPIRPPPVAPAVSQRPTDIVPYSMPDPRADTSATIAPRGALPARPGTIYPRLGSSLAQNIIQPITRSAPAVPPIPLTGDLREGTAPPLPYIAGPPPAPWVASEPDYSRVHGPPITLHPAAAASPAPRITDTRMVSPTPLETTRIVGAPPPARAVSAEVPVTRPISPDLRTVPARLATGPTVSPQTLPDQIYPPRHVQYETPLHTPAYGMPGSSADRALSNEEILLQRLNKGLGLPGSSPPPPAARVLPRLFTLPGERPPVVPATPASVVPDTQHVRSQLPDTPLVSGAIPGARPGRTLATPTPVESSDDTAAIQALRPPIVPPSGQVQPGDLYARGGRLSMKPLKVPGAISMARPRAPGHTMKMAKPAPTPGAPGSNPSMPFSPPRAPTTPYGHTGGLLSSVAGRTDHIPLDVPNGAYVLPADVISGMGQGNTLHGTKIADTMFKGAMHMVRPLTLNRAVGMHMTGSMAAGGVGGNKGKGSTVPIMAAGGEYVIPPEVVTRLGRGNMKKGHSILDQFVTRIRSKTISQLKKLPGPVKRAEGGRVIHAQMGGSMPYETSGSYVPWAGTGQGSHPIGQMLLQGSRPQGGGRPGEVD